MRRTLLPATSGDLLVDLPCAVPNSSQHREQRDSSESLEFRHPFVNSKRVEVFISLSKCVEVLGMSNACSQYHGAERNHNR